MLIQAVRFTFAPEDSDHMEAIFRELRDLSLAEAGVIAFDVGRGTDDANVFALWEVYRDRAALDFHKASDHYQRLVVNGIRPKAKNRVGDVCSPVANATEDTATLSP